jgi:hypothetical protein
MVRNAAKRRVSNHEGTATATSGASSFETRSFGALLKDEGTGHNC